MSKYRMALAAIVLGLAPVGWMSWPAGAAPNLGPELSQSDGLSEQRIPGGRFFGTDGPNEDLAPGFRGHGPDASPKPERPDSRSADAKPPSREETLARLFDRLAKTTDPDEATGVASLIERMWMRSGSDTADLLMARAVMAMGNNRHDVARALLDKVVALRPDWAEAWNKRATLRFLEDDDAGSMEDISHVLALEPRHFGALSGLGFILKRNGLEKEALKALRRAEEIYPENADIRKAVDELVPDVEGRDL